MRISAEKLKLLCTDKQLNIKELLSMAGVSRNAYYSLVRKGSVLPRSVIAIAARLGVNPSAFLESADIKTETRLLLAKIDAICSSHQHADRDTIRHTLMLLHEPPIDRLRRALLRGKKFNIRRKRNSISQGTDTAAG
jgi:predicted DNA-binding transcriptional regulator AlpA